MRLRVRHVYDFGPGGRSIGDNLVSPEGWDAARELPGPFGLPQTRAEWQLAGRTEANVARARDVLGVIAGVGARRVCSYGVGTALLEQQVARLAPDVALVCTDFTPRAVARLRELFPEAEVRLHDLRRDPLPAVDLHVMHRLDQELTDDEWRRVFAQVEAPVLFVPSEILDLQGAVRAVLRRLRNRHATAAGWFRSEAALRALWSARFADRPVAVGGLRGFVLERSR